jgi:hypothetical protein
MSTELNFCSILTCFFKFELQNLLFYDFENDNHKSKKQQGFKVCEENGLGFETHACGRSSDWARGRGWFGVIVSSDGWQVSVRRRAKQAWFGRHGGHHGQSHQTYLWTYTIFNLHNTGDHLYIFGEKNMKFNNLIDDSYFIHASLRTENLNKRGVTKLVR